MHGRQGVWDIVLKSEWRNVSKLTHSSDVPPEGTRLHPLVLNALCSYWASSVGIDIPHPYSWEFCPLGHFQVKQPHPKNLSQKAKGEIRWIKLLAQKLRIQLGKTQGPSDPTKTPSNSSSVEQMEIDLRQAASGINRRHRSGKPKVSGAQRRKNSHRAGKRTWGIYKTQKETCDWHEIGPIYWEHCSLKQTKQKDTISL